ncbi:hypothetical protein CLIM01_13978 [Colletotrichum limetticola]|uniref:Uncharacterized protein n=1 Tax=Colletotrichum limetticola TaxID=1209924 RepID=A0ABQ9PAU8_9PEZI|nr:hypothetical protein CLIM01_13978 [Colletotrichum limetticola]
MFADRTAGPGFRDPLKFCRAVRIVAWSKTGLPGPSNWFLCWSDRSSQRAIGTFTAPIPTFWDVGQLLSSGSGATIL